MLWPLVLPFKITFWALLGFVALLTLVSPAFKWDRGRTFFVSALFACVVFFPSCAGIQSVLDAHRFGTFSYDAFHEVDDFRVERYLPTRARNITVEKFPMGHRAKYEITKPELVAYLDDLWRRAGENSATSRDDLDDGSVRSYDQFSHQFDGLNWPVLKTAVELHSPKQNDGGGATYYFDESTNTVYHRAGYW